MKAKRYTGLFAFDTETHKYVPVASLPELWEYREKNESK